MFAGQEADGRSGAIITIAGTIAVAAGQSVVIDNRPGASGNLALQAAAGAPADGYTLLLVATPHAINVTKANPGKINMASTGTGNLPHGDQHRDGSRA